MQLQFLGATGTVTGSKYLLRHEGATLLVDCGLFQGYKQLRLRNWAPMPVPAAGIDAIVLTHAHIDHSGYVPLLARQGFKRQGLLHGSNLRAVSHPAARQRPPAGGGSRVRQPARLLQAQAGAAAVHPRGRRALSEAVLAAALWHRLEPGARPAGAPGPVGAHAGLGLREDRRRSALDPVLRRHRSSERPGAGRAGTRAGCRLRRDRVHLWRPPARGERSAAQAWRGHQPHGRSRRCRGDSGLRSGPRAEPDVLHPPAQGARHHPPICRSTSTARWPPTRRASTTRTAASTG